MTEITNESDLETLTLLGNEAQPTRKLEVFPNHNPERDYRVTLQTDEFTCICPKTGQPDFAKITITYIPDQSILESKSLKLYLCSYREEGAFHEHVTNTILNDLVQALEPRWCKITAAFAVRGGIDITVDAEYKKPVPAPAVRAVSPEDHPRPLRWEGGGERSRPERETSRPTVEKRWTERDSSRPPVEKRWAERDSSRPPVEKRWAERDASRPPVEKRWADRDSSRPPVEKRWAERDASRPQEEKRWPAKREYRSDRGDSRPPVKREYRDNREKSWSPAPGGERTPTFPKRSERKTTKSLGVTRTWRKRI